jgi:15-cis-phytoene synthase
MSATTELAEAYAHCEAVTRAQAANFFYGIRLLPRERRRAMSAVYAFARRVDDIGDGSLPREQKLAALEGEARALAAITPAGDGALAGGASALGVAAQDAHAVPDRNDLVMLALADTQRRFALPADALGELIEGVRMDVEGTAYEGFEELVVYCRRVAGGIGRLCLAIFGLREDAAADGASAERLADDLGVALQLTNILRDVREDAENGRVYLPAVDLRRFGVIAAEHHAGDDHSGEDQAASSAAADVLGALARASAGAVETGTGENDDLRRLSALVRFECERAAQWFDDGLALTELLDRRSAACVLAMAGIYRRLLERIDAHPDEAVRRRMSLPAHEKAWVAARGMLGVGA